MTGMGLSDILYLLEIFTRSRVGRLVHGMGERTGSAGLTLILPKELAWDMCEIYTFKPSQLAKEHPLRNATIERCDKWDFFTKLSRHTLARWAPSGVEMWWGATTQLLVLSIRAIDLKTIHIGVSVLQC